MINSGKSDPGLPAKNARLHGAAEPDIICICRRHTALVKEIVQVARETSFYMVDDLNTV